MSTDALASVADLVAQESGIVIGQVQRRSLVAAIAHIAPGMTAGRLQVDGCTGDTLERLIDEITVRETFFFRHRTELDTIDWHEALLAARARGTDAVRVWIAGCASGEEAYTIAILACEAFGTATPPVRILATDIAPTALAQARRGRYGVRAVRTLDEAVRRRYFSFENPTLCVSSSLRTLVEVRRHNLVRDSFPPVGSPPFDLILCRNVLIYFGRSTVDRVLASLEGALWPGGRLMLGAADRISGQPRRSPAPLPRGATKRRRTVPVVPKPTGRGPAPPRASVARAASRASVVPAAGEATVTAGGEGRRGSGALRAADRGDLEAALQIAGDVLLTDPLDAEAHFVTGLAELARERPRAAITSLRRALYIDPTSGLAAFKLARAHEALGEPGPARRAYRQALRTLELDINELSVAETRDVAEVTTACRARLQALATQL
jgi:chemotaxis methyl-accepting protein methylase